MIIAIDFDGTICETIGWPDIGQPVPYAVETIKELYAQGHVLVLWTLREDQHLDSALECLERLGVRECFRYVNENIPEAIQKYDSDPRKIGAEIFIDDRSLGWSGWIPVREYFGFADVCSNPDQD